MPGDAYWIDNLRVDSASLRPYAPVALEVSLNGQDFTSAGLRFGYHPVTVVSRLTPPGGPLSGGTLVLVSGASLGGGDGYSCRFGSSALLTVQGSYDSALGAVRCVSPAAGSALNTTGVTDFDFGLALNSQDFSTAGPPFRCVPFVCA